MIAFHDYAGFIGNSKGGTVSGFVMRSTNFFRIIIRFREIEA